jgi:uncharacterized protein (DUF58 family)
MNKLLAAIVPRSWIVIVLWLVTLQLALLFPGDGQGSRDIFLNLSYLFGGLLVLSFLWARLSLLGVRVTRQLRSNRSQVGKYAEELLTVDNTAPLPKLWLEVRDFSDLPGHRVSRVLNWLPARARRSWVIKTSCQRRGRFRLGPITLYAGDPFGLFVLRRDLELTGSIVVYPPTADLPAFAPRLGELSGGSLRSRRTHHVTTNVAGVRDYVPGDSFGRIHWRSSARTGRLIVKEFELDPQADIWLYLDMEMGVHVGELPPPVPEPPLALPPVLRAPPLDPTTEEYAIAIAAALARHFLDRGSAVGLVTYARDQRRLIAQADRGARQLDRLLSMLAVVHAFGRVPLGQVLDAETVYLTRNAVAIAVTPAVERTTWPAALRRLAQRGVRTLAVVLDPASFTPAPTFASMTSRANVAPERGLTSDVLTTLTADLLEARVPCYIVCCGDALADVLRG